MSDSVIPIFYSIAMFTDAIAALIFGKIFDKIGMKTLLLAILLSSFFAPMVFFGWFLLGIIRHDCLGYRNGRRAIYSRAEIAEIIPAEKRETAFGTFNAAYGLFWFAGSALMGFLYDFSLSGLIFFSVITQLLAFLIIIYILWKNKN